jgi:type IV secretory pathway VirB10-like protein
MNQDQYGIDVPALPRFMRRLDAVCLCRGGGGKKKAAPKPAPKPAAPAPANNQAAQMAAQQQQAAAAAQQRQAEILRQQQADAAASDAERARITADNERVAAENASYDQAQQQAAVSQIGAATQGSVQTATQDKSAAMRRRRGSRTSILAGDTGTRLGGGSTLG